MTRLAAAVVLGLGLAAVTVSGDEVSDAIALTTRGRPELIALYEPRANAPLWLAQSVTPSTTAREALSLLKTAAQDGLDSGDYRIDDLASLARRISDNRADCRTIAAFDTLLSEQVLRYMRDLHVGRVNPSMGPSARADDLPRVLREAVGSGRLTQAVRALAPRDGLYAPLVEALARYRHLPSSGPVTVQWPSKSIHPGEPFADVKGLFDWLRVLGDVSASDAPPDGRIYAGATVAGVVRFQRRHGLEPDGVIGRRTIAQLSVPISWRIRQLELAMERLRWFPDAARQRTIVVNIPMFQLQAWDAGQSGSPAFSSRIIVGKAVTTETPIFSATLDEILFRPYWNVPLSIVRKEILPKLRADADYMRREDMELVVVGRTGARVVDDTVENRRLLSSGAVRLRQRPGPRNALGTIKFSLPNVYDVYLHATPASALFERSRRDFSHGCVRVQDPVGLAEWVLSGQAGWDRAAIQASMDAEESSSVPVRSPVLVMVAYLTASVDTSSGAVLFADDIYGLDSRLAQALAER